MIATLNLPLRTRFYIKRTPWLYRLAKRLKDRRAKSLLCDRTTDLCIEGYPASGNLFSFALLHHANNSLRIAHHCHSVANLKFAFKYDVPAACLIRHPESAISSRLARFGGNLEYAVLDYTDFYGFVLQHADRLTIGTFEELTQNTGEWLGRLAQETGLAFSLENVEDMKEKATRGIREWHEKHGIPEKLPLPLAEREETKVRIRQEIRNCRYYPDAVVIWQRVTQRE